MNQIIIKNQIFKQYDNTYYVSAYGDIYSTYSHKCLKHNIDIDGYHRVDIHSKHMKVHKLVYLTWIGNIPNDKQINHKDDNKNNNYYLNLYTGTQAENISDCIKNKHREGNINYLTVYDKKMMRIITFCPSSKFIEYSNHPCKNRSVKRMFSKNWFKKRYMIIDYNKKSVTTMADECKPVE